MNEHAVLATGRRKTATARVEIYPGKGLVQVNKRKLEEYFPTETQRMIVLQPLKQTNLLQNYDVQVRVEGGGLMGQAGAVRHGIARALLKADENLRLSLRKAGFLTRDPRRRERKKYGQKGARKRFQYSKR